MGVLECCDSQQEGGGGDARLGEGNRTVKDGDVEERGKQRERGQGAFIKERRAEDRRKDRRRSTRPLPVLPHFYPFSSCARLQLPVHFRRLPSLTAFFVPQNPPCDTPRHSLSRVALSTHATLLAGKI